MYEPVHSAWGTFDSESDVTSSHLGLYSSNLAGDLRGIFVLRYTIVNSTTGYFVQKLNPENLSFLETSMVLNSSCGIVNCANGVLCVVDRSASAQRVLLFDTKDLSLIKEIDIEGYSLTSAVVFDGEYIYAGYYDSAYKIFKIDIETEEYIISSDSMPAPFLNLILIKNKIYASANKQIYEWDANDLTILRTVSINYYVFGGNSEYIYAGNTSDGLVKISLESFSIVLQNPSILSYASSAYVDGDLYICNYPDGYIRLISEDTLEENGYSKIGYFVRSVFVSTDFPYIYVTAQSGSSSSSAKPINVHKFNNFVKLVGYKEVKKNVSI